MLNHSKTKKVRSMSEKCNTESPSSLAGGVLTVRGKDAAKVAMALSSPIRVQILNFIRGKEADIQEIAGLTKQGR